MKNCKNCNNPMDDNQKFCNKCGMQYLDLNNLGYGSQQPQPIQTAQPVQPKEKKSKKKILVIPVAIICAVAILSGVLSVIDKLGSDYSDDDLYYNESGSLTTEAPLDLNSMLKYDTGIKMTDDIFDYQIKIGDSVFQFPMSVENFKKAGFNYSIYEDPESMLSSTYADSVWFVMADGSELCARVVNFAKSEAPIKNCHVVGLEIECDGSLTNELLFDYSLISLTKGITLSTSTADDIKTAYGDPTEIIEYDDSDYQIFSYAEEGATAFNTFELKISKATQKLIGIEIKCVNEPDDVIEVGVSKEVPELVANYKAPGNLGKDVVSGNYKLEGVVYKLPTPVSELIKNGWKIAEAEYETIPANDSVCVVLQKGEVKIESVYIRNYEEYETTLENGIITQISTVDFEVGGMGELIFPQEITEQVSEDDVMKLIRGKKYTEEASNFGKTITIAVDVSDGSITFIISFQDGVVSYASLYWYDY